MVLRSGRWPGQWAGGFVRHRPAGARRIQGSRLPPSAWAQASRKSDRPNTASGAVAARSRRGAGEWPRWWPRCAAGAWASPMLKRSRCFRASRSAAWPEGASATWRAMRACTPANPIVSVFVGALKARTQQSLGSLPAGIACPLLLRDQGRAHQARVARRPGACRSATTNVAPPSSSAVGLTGRGIRARRLVHPKVLWRACQFALDAPGGPAARCQRRCKHARWPPPLQARKVPLRRQYLREARKPLGLTDGFHTSLSEA